MKLLAANTLLQNRYLIVHLIGKGGMGDVYLAIDQRLGSAVALKRTFFSGDEILADAFEREARTLARLRHNVLPKVSDHFTEEDTQYLIMEHIAGDDLAKRLEVSEKQFPVGWVLFWADQLLDALGYMHAQEPPVIHRDIKPQNLKLTGENTVILLDFGLSKNTPGETRASSTASVIGYTPHFAPMEQIRGTGTNPRSDIYSLSATLYQLLSNVVPPDVLARADELLSGKPDPIQPLDEINPDISREISDIILKGMAISQEQRFADAREMQKALREAYAQIQNTSTKPTVALNAQSSNGISGISQPLLKTNISRTSPPASKSIKSLPPGNDRQSEEVFSRPASQSPIQKKSNRRLVTIIGFGLPLVLLITAGLGWFILYNSEAATKKISTPTPITATVTPTPETALESNLNANANVDVRDESNLNDNANIETSNQTGDADTQNTNDKTNKTSQPTVIKSTPKQAPKPPAKVKKSAPRPTPPPKATPLPRILP